MAKKKIELLSEDQEKQLQKMVNDMLDVAGDLTVVGNNSLPADVTQFGDYDTGDWEGDVSVGDFDFGSVDIDWGEVLYNGEPWTPDSGGDFGGAS